MLYFIPCLLQNNLIFTQNTRRGSVQLKGLHIYTHNHSQSVSQIARDRRAAAAALLLMGFQEEEDSASCVTAGRKPLLRRQGPEGTCTHRRPFFSSTYLFITRSKAPRWMRNDCAFVVSEASLLFISGMHVCSQQCKARPKKLPILIGSPMETTTCGTINTHSRRKYGWASRRLN